MARGQQHTMRIVADSRGVIQDRPDLPTSFTFSSPVMFVTNQNIYANASTGNDSNDGSAVFPLKTLGAALSRVGPNAGCRIFLASGSYTLAGGSDIRLPTGFGVTSSYDIGSNSSLYSPVPFVEIIGGYDVILTGTISSIQGVAPSRVYYNDNTKSGLGVGVYDGMTFSCTGGSGLDDFQIVENTTSSFAISVWSGGSNPVSGSRYEIRKPNVILAFSGTSLGNDVAISGPTALSLKRLVFSGTLGTENMMLSSLHLSCVETIFTNLNNVTFYDSVIESTGSVVGPGLFFNTASCNLDGTILGNHTQPKVLVKNGGFYGVNNMRSARVNLYVRDDSSSFQSLDFDKDSQAQFFCLVVTCSVPYEAVGVGNFPPYGGFPSTLGVIYSSLSVEKTTIYNNLTGSGITLSNDSKFNCNGPLVIRGTNAGGVIVLSGSQFRRSQQDITGIFTMTGSGAANFDIQVGTQTSTSASFITRGFIFDSGSLSYACTA